MIKFKKLTIALLALLSVSATAWAAEETLLVTINSTGENASFTSGSKTFDDKATVTFNGAVQNSGDEWGWYQGRPGSTIAVSAAEGYTVTRVKFFCRDGSAFDTEAPFEATVTQIFANESYIYKTLVNNENIGGVGVQKIEVYGYEGTAGPEVTINDDKSEATFEMPDYDVTATYTLKRDMTVEMSVSVQDAEQNSRFRVQKQGNVFVPVGLTNEQVMALFKVHDDIESKDLTATTDYTVQIFAANDEGQPTGTAMTFQNFTYAPGNYVVKAVAVEGSNYSGETALSNVFTLFQGYEVTIPAGEYATYYKDEALYVEDTDAQLYTITAVSGDKATATELTTAAANTPLLVKNNASEAKTILLIPTTDRTPDNVTAYNGFVGTLEATQIAASTDAQNNYAFNGLQFVWVKTALNIGANKCWLAVPVTGVSSARALSIVFDSETTGIGSVLSGTTAEGDWYDLNGRKLNRKPTRKGVYIVNGKKVVVK